MSAKKVVKDFYDLDLVKDTEAISHFHKNCKVHWNSSQGYLITDYNGLEIMLSDFRKSFLSFKYRLSHLLEDGNMVTARYTIYAIPIENPDEEQPLAHFISIWEVKDDKLYKGYEISQLANEDPANLNAFSEIKL